MEYRFKDIEFICHCGRINTHTLLLENGYGFDTVYCDCKTEYRVEYYDNQLSVKRMRRNAVKSQKADKF